jgi:hypothetical protein
LTEDIGLILSSSIVEQEIAMLANSEYESLVVLKFAFSLNGIIDKNSTKDTLKNFFKDVYSITEEAPFINIYNSNLIFLKNREIFDADSLSKRIEDKIDTKLIDKKLFDMRFEITEVYKDDTLETLIDRLVDEHTKTKFIDTVSEASPTSTHHEGASDDLRVDEIIEILKKIHKEEKVIKIHNFYKGVNIFRDVDIVNVSSKGLIFHTSKTRALILSKESFTFLKHRLFAKTIKAQIVSVNVDKGLVVLDDFTMLTSSPVNRKLIRVEPKSEISINIYHPIYPDIVYGGVIQNISIKSIAFALNKPIHGMSKNDEMKLKFLLPNVDNKLEIIATKAKVFNIRGDKVIVHIFPKKLLENKIFKYITYRQKELIQELRDTIH